MRRNNRARHSSTNLFVEHTDLECASDILITNGANKESIHHLIATGNPLSQLQSSSFDLVFSLMSYGHHPISTYLEEVKRLLTQGGVLVLDLMQTCRLAQIILIPPDNAYGNRRELLTGTQY